MEQLASLLVLGILAQWLAWRAKIPSIVLLIITGLLAGPFWPFITGESGKFISGDEIFQGDLLFDFISLSVGIILFEGGMTLKFGEVTQLRKVIRNLLIIGSAVTMLGGALAAYYVLDLGWQLSLLFGSLIIVTGPTVIGPILRNIRANTNVSTILKWEGILIDPIGALVAILTYEFIISLGVGGNTMAAFADFGLKALIGGVVGAGFAQFMAVVLKRNWIPRYLTNVVILCLVVMSFAIADLIEPESGLLAVTIAGVLLGNQKIKNLEEILSFKADIVTILISVLFILLASRIELADIQALGVHSLWVLAIVIFLIRPLGVFLSTWKQEGITLNEKVFISWVGPRGIVAAGVASLFSVRLEEGHLNLFTQEEIRILLPLTFLIILGTVILQGFSARPLARLLKVQHIKAYGIVFLGANEAIRKIATYIQELGVDVILSDVNRASLYEAQKMGLKTYHRNLLEEDGADDVDLNIYGQVWAITPNSEVNFHACRILTDDFGEDKTFRIRSRLELNVDEDELPDGLLFNGLADFYDLVEVCRKNEGLSERVLEDWEDMEGFLADHQGRIIPLFILNEEKKVWPMTKGLKKVEKGDRLFYLSR